VNMICSDQGTEMVEQKWWVTECARIEKYTFDRINVASRDARGQLECSLYLGGNQHVQDYWRHYFWLVVWLKYVSSKLTSSWWYLTFRSLNTQCICALRPQRELVDSAFT
jgi:hypothetical protein